MEKIFYIKFKKDYFRQMGILENGEKMKLYKGECGLTFTKKELWSLKKFINETKLLKGYNPKIIG